MRPNKGGGGAVLPMSSRLGPRSLQTYTAMASSTRWPCHGATPSTQTSGPVDTMADRAGKRIAEAR
jgi:hypothetical protein